LAGKLVKGVDRPCKLICAEADTARLTLLNGRLERANCGVAHHTTEMKAGCAYPCGPNRVTSVSDEQARRKNFSRATGFKSSLYMY